MNRWWGPLGAWARPLDASLDGHRSDSLFLWATFALLILFVSLVGIILWSTLVQRPQARYETGVGRGHLLFTLAVSLTLFVVVDGTLLLRAGSDLRNGFWRSSPGETVEVEVLARQWSFAFRHAGPDGQLGTADDPVATDELHVPVGRPVALRMRSVDVIHNLYLPNFRIKQDIIPGHTTQLLFTPTRVGRYELGCSQHCGVNHYKMHGELVVDEPAAFAAWQATASQEAALRDDARNPETRWGWPWSQW